MLNEPTLASEYLKTLDHYPNTSVMSLTLNGCAYATCTLTIYRYIDELYDVMAYTKI